MDRRDFIKIAGLFSLAPGIVNAGRLGSLKIGIITDVHFSDHADLPCWVESVGVCQYRRFSTAATRLGQAITTFNAQGVDIVLDLGDFIDGTISDDGQQAIVQAAVTQLSALTMPWIYVAGNHEFVQYNTAQKVTDYYTDLDVFHATRSNAMTHANGWPSYTYDIKGVRFIMLFTRMYEDETHEANVLSWLETQLSHSPHPVVVCSHLPLWDCPTVDGWSTYDWENIQTVLQASEKVQMVLSGHYHRGNQDATLWNTRHIHLYGSVLCPNESDNAYYIIEFVPNTVLTETGYRPNIKITGYGSNGTAKTEAFTKYNLFGA